MDDIWRPPCPSLWGIISEMMVEISNVLIHKKFWYPYALFDPLSKTLPPPLSLPDNIPFHPAKELAVPLPIDDAGKANVYIDDILWSAPDLE